MRIYFLRHGETDYNKKMIVQGSGVDSSLNETGQRQSRAFFEHYANLGFDKVMTSALRRTQETVAGFIAAGIPWEAHAAINEIGWGIHEGAPASEEIYQHYLAVNAAWEKGDYDARVQGGESAAELEQRVRLFLRRLLEQPAERLLVCSHGRTLSVISCLLQELPLSQMNRFKHHNTGLTEAVYAEEVFQLLRRNDTSHLEGGV